MHLAAVQPESAGAAGGDRRSEKRILAFQAPRQSWARAIALSMQKNFGVPKCHRSAFGAARVHKPKSLRKFLKAPN
jgi:hypothetical protein